MGSSVHGVLAAYAANGYSIELQQQHLDMTIKIMVSRKVLVEDYHSLKTVNGQVYVTKSGTKEVSHFRVVPIWPAQKYTDDSWLIAEVHNTVYELNAKVVEHAVQFGLTDILMQVDPP